MASFRVNMTIEVDQQGNALRIETPVLVQLTCEDGQWGFACGAPPVRLEGFTTSEEALVAGARRVADELQAAVVERPVVVGRITPESVAGLFR